MSPAVRKEVYVVTIPNFFISTPVFSISLKFCLQFLRQNAGALVTQPATLLWTTLNMSASRAEVQNGRDREREKKTNLQCSPHSLGSRAPPNREGGILPSGF